MPLKRCQNNGEEGWQWGDGKCYTGPGAKKKAIQQAVAIGEGSFPTKSDDGGIMSKFSDWLVDRFFEEEMEKEEETTEENEEVETEKNRVSTTLKSLMNSLAGSKRETATLIESMAEKAGITEDAVRKTLNSAVQCPPRENLVAFSEALDVNPNALIRAAKMDGCDMDFIHGVSTRGTQKARVAFVGASPSKVDAIRKKAFCGTIEKTLDTTYLDELDIEKDEAMFLNLVPVYKEDEDGSPREPTQEEIEEWSEFFKYELERHNPDVIVALGTTARDGLEKIFDTSFDETVDEFVPHPRAVQMHGDSGEVARKFKRLNKTLQFIEQAEIVDSEEKEANLIKTDDELRVGKYIVYEPGVEDTDGNWTTRREIEKAAHKFLRNGEFVIGKEHVEEMDGAYLVESHIQEQDTTIGGKEVKAGSWIIGVQFEDDKEWEAVKSGDYTGVSFGGTAKINPSLRLNN